MGIRLYGVGLRGSGYGDPAIRSGNVRPPTLVNACTALIESR